MTTQELLQRAKGAKSAMALAGTQTKNKALLAMADALEQHQEAILAANRLDLDAARELHCRVGTAPGLPGRTAPRTAAAAIRDSIYHILEERGEPI